LWGKRERNGIERVGGRKKSWYYFEGKTRKRGKKKTFLKIGLEEKREEWW